jgi:hypothetical protein
MKIKKFSILNIIITLFILNPAFCDKAFSQSTGSLFMLQENFHSQILNPSYMRNDDALVISIVGLAGATVGNTGSFKISDIITENQFGKKIVNFEHFYDAQNAESNIVDWSSIPVVFVGIPLREGRLNFYFKEQVQSSVNFNTTVKEFPDFENIKSYNTDDIVYSGMGYSELAVGYSRKINEIFTIGIRGKILFGATFLETEDWIYGVDATNNNQNLELTHKGTGKLVLPIKTKLDKKKMVRSIDGGNTLGKYLSSFQNPGLGVDLGATININEKSWLSVSATDLGAIWFRHNTMNIEQDTSYIFNADEIIKYSKKGNTSNYFDSYNLILNTKDDIPYLYRPYVDTTSFVQGLVAKTSVHYQYIFSDRLSFGATNQLAFYKKNILNILSVSSLQKRGNFSIFESVNLYGLSTITVGGGLQYEGRFGQIFASADNLLAVYQPINNKSFSFSVGISLLLNKPAEKKISKGNFSPYFPFYENRK